MAASYTNSTNFELNELQLNQLRFILRHGIDAPCLRLRHYANK